MQRQHLWMILILIFYGIVGSFYIATVPLFEASDEAEHFIYVHTILDTQSLPVIQSREEMANQTDPILRWNNQSHHAPLYYLTAAFAASWSERADIADYLHPNELIFLRNTVEDNPNKWLHRYTPPTSDTHIAIYLLRSLNLLLGAATLIMVYSATQQLDTGSDTPLLAMLFTASIPTFVVVNTSVTNDALVIFLYSTGIYWLLKTWRTETFSRLDIASISLILAGIALTKLTGVTLFGLIYLGLIAGVIRQKWQWQQALKVIVISGSIAAILAGWWYVRNLTLYGDLLAVDATASIWGRDVPLTTAAFMDNLLRIGKSFWMLMGYLHFPVFVPDAFYIYATSLMLIGFVGTLIYTRQNKAFEPMSILLVACLVVIAMLIYGTLTVDISYGRLLMPAIAAFAPLVIIGLVQIFRRLALLFILPLSITTLLIPVIVVPVAYPTLLAVDEMSATATRVNWQSDGLEIVAIDTPHTVFNAGDVMTVDLYFRGNHPTNPALTITAVDTIRVQRFDHIEIYPGMADMRYLPDDQLFKARFQLDITQADTVLAPRIINILVEWIDLDTNMALVFDSDLSLLEVIGGTFVDTDYQAPELNNAAPINFGGEIILQDYAIPDLAIAGDMIPLSFIWQATDTLSTINDATLTLQLFDNEGNLVAQDDGALWWYPTSAWAATIAFEDTRQFDIPQDLATGDYQLGIGWYRTVDDMYPRLIPDADPMIDNLYRIPLRVTADSAQ